MSPNNEKHLVFFFQHSPSELTPQPLPSTSLCVCQLQMSMSSKGKGDRESAEAMNVELQSRNATKSDAFSWKDAKLGGQPGSDEDPAVQRKSRLMFGVW